MTVIIQRIQLKHMVGSLPTYFKMLLEKNINKMGSNYRGYAEAMSYPQSITVSDERIGLFFFSTDG